MMREDAPVRLHPHLAYRRVEDHVFLLNDEDEFLVLNDPVSLSVWEAIEGEAGTLDSAVARVLEEFDVDEDTARADVRALLASLAESRAITVSD